MKMVPSLNYFHVQFMSRKTSVIPHNSCCVSVEYMMVLKEQKN